MKETIKMSKKELNRIAVIEKSLNKKVTNAEGANRIGISIRQFQRLKAVYKREGAEGLAHKSRGRTSNRKISQGEKDYAIKIIKKEYHDFGPTLAHEKLTERGLIVFSVETLRKEMIKTEIHKEKQRRKADIHQSRERRSQFGELVQADGSPHAWFEERCPVCDLIVFIDDATGKLLWLEFVESENTRAYFISMKKYILIHGKPLALYVDKHSVFRVNTNNNQSSSTTDSKTLTQFGRALEELSIEMIYANSAQAKGRVERANKTLQDRLVKEMRLKNISSLEEGNRYLPEFIEYFNNRFSVDPKSRTDVHRPLLKEDNLEETLCFKETRVVSKNLTIQYKNKTYLIEVKQGYEYTMRKARVDVIEKLDKTVLIQYRGRTLNYKVKEIRKPKKICNSKNLNKTVDNLKSRQGKKIQFNLAGVTFLLWRKTDISNLG